MQSVQTSAKQVKDAKDGQDSGLDPGQDGVELSRTTHVSSKLRILTLDVLRL